MHLVTPRPDWSVLEDLMVYMNKSIKPGGFHVVHSDINEFKNKIKQGYKFIAYGDDMLFISEKFDKESKKIKKIVDNK